MPNYPTHARWGRIGGGAVALVVGTGLFVLFDAPVLAGVGALGAGCATFVGALFPDVDHHKSVPRQKAVRGLRALVALCAAALTGLQFDLLVSVADTVATNLAGKPPLPPAALVVGGVAVTTLVLAWAVDPAIGVVTREHRGWTHSAPVTFALTAALVAATLVATRSLALPQQVTAGTVTGTFFLGILVHLGLDDELV